MCSSLPSESACIMNAANPTALHTGRALRYIQQLEGEHVDESEKTSWLQSSMCELRDTIRRRWKILAALGLVSFTGAGCSSASFGTPAATPTFRAVPSYTPDMAAQQPGGRVEIEQFGANTFANYQNASGEGPYLPIGQRVVTACLIYDPGTSVLSTGGLWYRLVQPAGPNGTTEYAPANTFWNQPDPQPPDQDHAYDPQVPVCPDSPSKQLPPP